MLVTGANQGIGFDTAWYLAAASPFNHVIVGARNEEKGLEALQKLQAKNLAGAVSLQLLDVTSDDSISAAAKDIEATFGKLDVLINNAGIGLHQPATRETLHEAFDTNVCGPAVLTDALAPLLKKSPDPRIVNVSSGVGSIAARLDPQNPYYHLDQDDSYRISKAALNMLTACMKYNYREDGFKVWAFCPGFVITDLGVSSDKSVDARKVREERGAESSEVSAQGILEIVEGKRDEEEDKFLQRYGGTWPW